jgi:hypothetical protein
MAKDVLVWITTRDGSVHATRPPITASGHPMLCGVSYGRQDLRIEAQGTVGHAPTGACPACSTQVAAAGSDAGHAVQERKAPIWP